jgi:hypothetical protein
MDNIYWLLGLVTVETLWLATIYGKRYYDWWNRKQI